jgi:hypothetical protein
MPSRKKSYRKTAKRGSRKAGKTSKRSSRTKRSSLTKRSCQTKLKNKIRINMSEYKKGRFSSRQQALAVSYAQVNKTGCKRYFKRG